MRRSLITTVSIIAVLALTHSSAAQISARISDLAKFKGPRVNRLQGLGLVVGLDGTGDGGDYKPAIEPLAMWLKHYANPVLSTEELQDTKNVAIVSLQAEIPPVGGREQDRLDVHVSAIGNCSSLAGGRLISAPLQHHSLVDRSIMGYAMGRLVLDAESNVNAVVHDGLVLEKDLLATFIAAGTELPGTFAMSPWVRADQYYVTLIIEDDRAGFGLATSIAQVINDDKGESVGDRELARAMDLKNVLVRIPEFQIDDPVPFLRDIEELSPLLPDLGARVQVSRSKQVIIVSGEVAISPVVLSVKGLTINILRAQDGSIQTPSAEQQSFIAIDPGQQGGPPLQRLIDQFNKIKVPFEDRVAVIEELDRIGAIHAQVRYED